MGAIPDAFGDPTTFGLLLLSKCWFGRRCPGDIAPSKILSKSDSLFYYPSFLRLAPPILFWS